MPARARAWRPSCDGNALSNPDRGRIPCLTPRLVVLLSVRRCLQRREWLASFGAPKSSSSPAPEGGALGEEHLIILDNCERHGLEHRSIASSQSGHAGELSGQGCCCSWPWLLHQPEGSGHRSGAPAACAADFASDARPARREGVCDPEPGRRPPGCWFVLRRTFRASFMPSLVRSKGAAAAASAAARAAGATRAMTAVCT